MGLEEWRGIGGVGLEKYKGIEVVLSFAGNPV